MARMVKRCKLCRAIFVQDAGVNRDRKTCSDKCRYALVSQSSRKQMLKTDRSSGKFTRAAVDNSQPGPNDPTPEEILQRKNEIRAGTWKQRWSTQ